MPKPIRTAFLFFAMVFPTLGTAVYFVLLEGSDQMDVAYYASKLIQVVIPLVGWFLLGMRRHQADSERGPGAGPGIASGLLLSVPILVTWLALRNTPFLEAAPVAIGVRLRAFGAATLNGYLVVAVTLSVVHSLFEEYYWRWFVFGALARRIHLIGALALSSLAFASHHVIVVDRFLGPERFWTATIPFALAVALGGGIWAWLFHRHRSLVSPWLSHLLVDATIMWIGYRMFWG